MGRTKKRSAGRKPVWQTRRGGRQPGARGPEAKDGFSELERAYLKVHRNAKGLTNQEIADTVGLSKRAVEAVLGGKRGADPDRLEAFASLVLPDQSVADLYLDFSPWLGRTTGGGSSGERIVGQDPQALWPGRNRDALTAPSTRLLETGMTTTSAPGVVAWEEKAKLKNDSREYDECIPERSPRQLRFDEVVPIPDNDGKLAEGGGHHHQAQREPDRFRPLASRLPGGGLLRLKSCTYDTIFRARPPP